MGLDITAYRQLTPDSAHRLNFEKPRMNRVRFGASMEWSESAFPGRGQGVESNITYRYTDIMRFRAGSYGGYGTWRRQLAMLAGLPDLTGLAGEDYKVAVESMHGKPFSELVNFADNEGVIGPVVSAKLAKDFRDHLPQAEALNRQSLNSAWFLAKYNEWMAAFEMAADGGAVQFC